jgi:hypothetical protein
MSQASLRPHFDWLDKECSKLEAMASKNRYRNRVWRRVRRMMEATGHWKQAPRWKPKGFVQGTGCPGQHDYLPV